MLQAQIGSSSNELTMKAVGTASQDHNSGDAIESFKKRNIAHNMGKPQAQLKPVVRQNLQVPTAAVEHEDEDEGEDLQDFDDHQNQDVDEEEMHAVEDFENLGHVINVQIGSGGSKDFFFR